MLNYIWLALVVLAVAIGGWNDRLNEVTAGGIDLLARVLTPVLAPPHFPPDICFRSRSCAHSAEARRLRS